ncbi:hypothetical protein IFT86_19665 [Pseudomonas syringae]|uniref:hypothetical protein n=1 Tax=Pseudomonas syringae TaxID=317 RepID=UPI0017873A3E|nr:hypothetical protein [Pseudomonas syringae]
MRRNFETARCILFAVQDSDKIAGISGPELEKFAGAAGITERDWIYGLKLMVGGGYLGYDNELFQLTWAGHNLLDELSKISR